MMYNECLEEIKRKKWRIKPEKQKMNEKWKMKNEEEWRGMNGQWRSRECGISKEECTKKKVCRKEYHLYATYGPQTVHDLQ